MATELAYFNLNNYRNTIGSLEIQRGYNTYSYLEDIHSENSNGYSILYNVRGNYYIATDAIGNQLYLNSNMVSFARSAWHLQETELLHKTEVNYLYVTNFHTSFANCFSLHEKPVSSKRMKSMYGSYYNCQNMYGHPNVYTNVTNLIGTYYNCVNITGQPICNNNVTIMKGTYYNCTNLGGSPVVAPNVISIEDCYYNCQALEGAPADCNKVFIATNAYYNCPNLYGDFYWYEPDYNIASKINAVNMFYGRNLANSLNIYVRNNSSVYNALLNYSATFGNIYGQGAITWTSIGNDYFNSYYNTTIKVLE